MDTVLTANAPQPAGHYSQATISGGLIFVSGQLPVDPKTKEIPDSIGGQTNLVIDHLDSILKASGSSLQKVVKVTVYISDISLWDEVNGVYAERFGEHKPARAIVPTRDLHFGCKIEMDAIAEK